MCESVEIGQQNNHHFHIDSVEWQAIPSQLFSNSFPVHKVILHLFIRNWILCTEIMSYKFRLLQKNNPHRGLGLFTMLTGKGSEWITLTKKEPVTLASQATSHHTSSPQQSLLNVSALIWNPFHLRGNPWWSQNLRKGKQNLKLPRKKEISVTFIYASTPMSATRAASSESITLTLTFSHARGTPFNYHTICLNKCTIAI